MTLGISVIIPAKNEERNLNRCLSSVAWADEVVLLDNHSTDRTAQIALSFPNVKRVETDWLGFAGTKIFGLGHAAHPWILWLDADEEIPADLAAEIRAAVAAAEFDAFDFPRRTDFLGEWVLHCGWYPGRVIRLFRRERATFNDRILHEGVDLLPGARLGHLSKDLLHYSYPSLRQYFDKMNGYGLPGAQELRRRGRRFRWVDLVLRPPLTFLKSYFLQGGYRDGAKGFIISVGSAFSMFIRYANLYYLEKLGTVDISRPAPD